MNTPGRRLAVVLFNLGGPDGPADVEPFLRNLFADPAIIRAPSPVRFVLSRLIARSRGASARANYAVMGGGSPLLAGSLAQAEALQAELTRRMPGETTRVFVSMRYWPPQAEAVAQAVDGFRPDRLVLLPLYPQYSTTTSASSLGGWAQAYQGRAETHAVCCWYGETRFLQAHAEAIESLWREAGSPKVRLLFSAHGLPVSIDRDGDPYRWQVEQTAAQVMAWLGEGWDWRVCYQSRVGPMKWLGPSTPDAIRQAAREGLGVLIDPIAFVSEHVETLVELDRDYARVARAAGASAFLRVPASGVSAAFIDGLAEVVLRALGRGTGLGPHQRPCPGGLRRCPFSEREALDCSSI